MIIQLITLLFVDAPLVFIDAPLVFIDALLHFNLPVHMVFQESNPVRHVVHCHAAMGNAWGGLAERGAGGAGPLPGPLPVGSRRRCGLWPEGVVGGRGLRDGIVHGLQSDGLQPPGSNLAASVRHKDVPAL